MARYAPPVCRAPDLEGHGTCDVRMEPMGERHPAFGPNYRPGVWVFLCPKCGSVRAIDEANVARYAERTRA